MIPEQEDNPCPITDVTVLTVEPIFSPSTCWKDISTISRSVMEIRFGRWSKPLVNVGHFTSCLGGFAGTFALQMDLTGRRCRWATLPAINHAVGERGCKLGFAGCLPAAKYAEAIAP